MAIHDSCPPGVSPSREFCTTLWGRVRTATGGEGPAAQAARDALCREYWYPLYAFLRRTGQDKEDARDLVQGFFAALFGKRQMEVADPGRGRFRSFLLGTLKHYLSDERKRARAAKRGGGQVLVSLEAEAAEARFQTGVEPAVDPEAMYDRDWALLLVGRVLNRLEAKYEKRGRRDLFLALRPCLGGTDILAPYAEIAARLGIEEDGLNVEAYRLRREYGRMLRAEVAATVRVQADIDEELRHLLRVTTQ